MLQTDGEDRAPELRATLPSRPLRRLPPFVYSPSSKSRQGGRCARRHLLRGWTCFAQSESQSFLSEGRIQSSHLTAVSTPPVFKRIIIDLLLYDARNHFGLPPYGIRRANYEIVTGKEFYHWFYQAGRSVGLVVTFSPRRLKLVVTRDVLPFGD